MGYRYAGIIFEFTDTELHEFLTDFMTRVLGVDARPFFKEECTKAAMAWSLPKPEPVVKKRRGRPPKAKVVEPVKLEAIA
jgi:hypothetical protein